MHYQSTVGLDAEQMRELVARIHGILDTGRSRRGRPPALGLYRSVVVALILLRSNLNQTTLADLFGVSQPTISRIWRTFCPLIEQALCVHVPSPFQVVKGRVPLIDGSLVPTGNRAGHEVNYSGKRRRAGLNIQVLATTEGDVLAVSDPLRGSVHDRQAFAETGWEELLADTPAIGDLGYRGTHIITPTRKPAHGELSTHDKQHNKELSKIRSAVERAIAHLKNWKILATGYRGRIAELPNIIRVVTKLEFYRNGW